jgi:hypothetical protein
MNDEKLLYVLEQIERRLASIETQTKLTNGRVSNSEKDILVMQTQSKSWTAFVIGAAAAISTLIGWMISLWK